MEVWWEPVIGIPGPRSPHSGGPGFGITGRQAVIALLEVRLVCSVYFESRHTSKTPPMEVWKVLDGCLESTT